MRVLIVGGGIGGLPLALALRAAGIEVVVFEREAALEGISIGGGLHLWPNGMRRLRAAGVEQEVLALGGRDAVLDRAEFATWRGRLLGAFPVDEKERRLGAPTVGVSRADLHGVLAGKLGAGTLRLDRKCTGFAAEVSSVAAIVDNGESEPGDVLIGADGLHSVVRAQLRGAEEPRYAGYASCQAFTGRRRTGMLVRSASVLSAAARWLRLRDALMATVAFSSFGFRQQLRELDYDF